MQGNYIACTADGLTATRFPRTLDGYEQATGEAVLLAHTCTTFADVRAVGDDGERIIRTYDPAAGQWESPAALADRARREAQA